MLRQDTIDHLNQTLPESHKADEKTFGTRQCKLFYLVFGLLVCLLSEENTFPYPVLLSRSFLYRRLRLR